MTRRRSTPELDTRLIGCLATIAIFLVGVVVGFVARGILG